MHTLRVGSLAYYRTLRGGFIACKVIAITPPPKSDCPITFRLGLTDWTIQVKVTARHPRGDGIAQGEILTTNGNNICPRSARYLRSGIYRVSPYGIESPTGEKQG